MSVRSFAPGQARIEEISIPDSGVARRSFEVEVYEKRGDLRREPVDTGKSIKMTLAARGLQALGQVGLTEGSCGCVSRYAGAPRPKHGQPQPPS